MTDKLTTLLAAIRDRAGVFTKLGPPRLQPHPGAEVVNSAFASAADVPRLLAALEAVLKLAAGWEKTAAIAHGKAERALAPQTSALLSGRAQAHQDCAQALREAITRELPREEAGDEKAGT